MNDPIDDLTNVGPTKASPPTKTHWLQRARESLIEELFDNDGLTAVFTHARNVLTGAAVLAAGLYAVYHIGNSPLPGMWTVHFAGYGIATFGAILLGLNLFDGMRKLARRKQHRVLNLIVLLFYIGLSVRLTQVILYFRSPV